MSLKHMSRCSATFTIPGREADDNGKETPFPSHRVEHL